MVQSKKLKTKIIRARNNKILAAEMRPVVAALKKGEPVVFPTDTVYGIGVSAFQFRGIKKIYRLKGRDFSKPLVWLISSVKALAPLVQSISPEAKILMKKYWPGPLTLIFRASWIAGLSRTDQGTIGIRFPRHALARALIEKTGCPLATTSANKSGRPSARNPADLAIFKSKVPFIITAGALPYREESTVIDVTVSPPLLLREGTIPKEHIAHALKIS
jgi:L-threonylcarbamoyladenylate synthase